MRRLIAAALLIAATACGGDSSGPESIAGTYTLRTINNVGLPFVLLQFDAQNKIEVLDASMTLNAGGTWNQVSRSRTTEDGVATTETENTHGSYTVTSGQIRLVNADDPDDIQNGSVGGGTLTIANGFITAVYRK